MSATDGMQTSRSIYFKHGNDGDEEYYLHSDAMHWDSHNKVHMAYELRGSEKRTTTNGNEYEARLRYGRLDVADRFVVEIEYYEQ